MAITHKNKKVYAALMSKLDVLTRAGASASVGDDRSPLGLLELGVI